jgi:hypothetical protein
MGDTTNANADPQDPPAKRRRLKRPIPERVMLVVTSPEVLETVLAEAMRAESDATGRDLDTIVRAALTAYWSRQAPERAMRLAQLLHGRVPIGPVARAMEVLTPDLRTHVELDADDGGVDATDVVVAALCEHLLGSAEKVMHTVKMPARIAQAIEDAVPAKGTNQTAVVEAALTSYLAKPSPEPAMQHARIAQDRDLIVTGKLTPLVHRNFRLPLDLRTALYARGDWDAKTHDEVTAADVLVAALTEYLLGSPEQAVLELAAKLMETHDLELRTLLNERGLALLLRDHLID